MDDLDQRLELHCDRLMVYVRGVRSCTAGWETTVRCYSCQQCGARFEATWTVPATSTHQVG